MTKTHVAVGVACAVAVDVAARPKDSIEDRTVQNILVNRAIVSTSVR